MAKPQKNKKSRSQTVNTPPNSNKSVSHRVDNRWKTWDTKVAVIGGVIIAIAALLTLILGQDGFKPFLFPSQTEILITSPISMNEPTAFPTSTYTFTPTLAPSSTSTPQTGMEAEIPTGYRFFDDFVEVGDLNQTIWLPTGELPTCNSQISNGYYALECQAIGKDLNFGMLPMDASSKVPNGISVAVQIEKPTQNGSIGLVLFFWDTQGKGLRDYHLRLFANSYELIALLPDWTPIRFTPKLSTSVGEPHILQAEYDSGELSFFVDGNKVVTDKPLDVPANAVYSGWKLEPYLYGDGATLSAKIFWVAMR